MLISDIYISMEVRNNWRKSTAEVPPSSYMAKRVILAGENILIIVKYIYSISYYQIVINQIYIFCNEANFKIFFNFYFQF